MRWWYLRRGVAWPAVLGCCAAAGATAVVLARWPSAALGLLPLLLASCAAAAAFVFDELAGPVVAVTPRGGGWRRTSRLAVLAVPLALWAVVVLAEPGDLPLERGGWLLIGAAAVLLTAGVAGIASRRDVVVPGPLLAPIVMLALLSPVVIGMFLGKEPLYPVGDFADGIRTFWLGVGAAGLVACGVALRPGFRP